MYSSVLFTLLCNGYFYMTFNFLKPSKKKPHPISCPSLISLTLSQSKAITDLFLFPWILYEWDHMTCSFL